MFREHHQSTCVDLCKSTVLPLGIGKEAMQPSLMGVAWLESLVLQRTRTEKPQEETCPVASKFTLCITNVLRRKRWYVKKTYASVSSREDEVYHVTMCPQILV